MPEERSEQEEMYIETIYRLTEEGGKAKTTEIAKAWKVAPASATEMVQKLAEKGLVDYAPYHGATLTADGMREAKDIIRKHRLLAMFLTDVVGMDEEEADAFACRMEHVIPDDLEEWVDEQLGRPERTAKGKVIPGKEEVRGGGGGAEGAPDEAEPETAETADA